MKTYQEIKTELDRLTVLNLKPGDWVWLIPHQKAQLKSPLAMVVLVAVTPEDETDDGLRVITPDKIAGKAE